MDTTIVDTTLDFKLSRSIAYGRIAPRCLRPPGNGSSRRIAIVERTESLPQFLLVLPRCGATTVFPVPPPPNVQLALANICWGWPPSVEHEALTQGVKVKLRPPPQALQSTSAVAASVGLNEERRSVPD